MLAPVIVDYATYSEGRRVDCPGLAQAVARARQHPRDFVWIGVVDPEVAHVRQLGELLELPALALEDIEHGRQRPKLETYAGLTVLAVSSLHYDDAAEAVETGHLMALASAGVVLTLRYGHAPPLGTIRKNMEADPQRLSLGPAAVVHALVDHVVDGYEHVLAGLDDDVEQIERRVFDNDRSNHAERIYGLKRELLEFRRALGPLVHPLERLVDGGLPGMEGLDGHGSTLSEYFRDVLDHARRDHDLLESLDRLLDQASEANTSQVAMYQNADQRSISAWAAIALVPTMISGVFGMNFDALPLIHWRWGFWVVAAATVAVCLGLYRGFRRSGWLGPGD